MRRLRKILFWLLAALVCIPVVAVAAILAALNTPGGQSFAVAQINKLAGPTVAVQGLSGRFPDRLRLAHVELHDDRGAYATADGVALNWSPLALLHKQALVNDLTAQVLTVDRLPVTDPNAKPTPSDPNAKPFQLPVEVTVEHLALPRVVFGTALLGTAAVASLDGQADLPTLQTGTARLAVTRTDSPGAYTLTAAIIADSIDAHLAVTEPDGGLIAHLASLPALGPLAVKADIAGPRSALATTLTLSAGPLTALAAGTVDLPGSRLALHVRADAPAMQPAPGVSWRAIALDTHVAGPFTAPDATGHLRIDDLSAGGASLTLTADLSGNAGQATVHAQATALRIPGPKPDLLAAAPLTLDVSARLDDPARPVTYRLAHPLLNLDGTARTAVPLTADASLALPDLAALAAAANVNLAGHTLLQVHAAQPRAGLLAATIDGTLALTAGPAPAPALLGPDAHLSLAAQMDGDTVTLTKATIQGAALTLDAAGQKSGNTVDATATLGLPNLSLLAPTLTGNATLGAHAHGPLDGIALDATATGDIGAPGVPRGPISVKANLTGLPATPSGEVTATGTLEGAPLNLALAATRDGAGTLHATIEHADWRSLHAEGALTLAPGATLPQGQVSLRFPQLSDLRPLLGQPLTGGITAALAIDGTAATLDLDGRNAGLPGTEVARIQLKARVADPLTRPVVAATLAADGIDAGTTTGSARVEVNGPQDALAVRANATLSASGTPAQIAAAALLDLPAKQVRLNTLQIDSKPPALATAETVRLLAPATVRFGGPITVDRLRLGLRQATLDVAGQLSPSLNATVALKANASDIPLPPAGDGPAANPYAGALSLDAKLTGTPAAPNGTVRLSATGLRTRSGPASSLPPANLTATAQLAGHAARLDARATAGTATIAVNGTAPIGAGPLNLHATGALDLALLDPILTAGGRRVRGRLTLDATATGSLAAPRLAGQAQLADGDVQDFTQGAHIANIAALVRADGQTVRLVSLTGRAGPGTVAASGTVGALAPGLPVDLAITLRNARPLASDTLSADLDADLTVKGSMERGLNAGGHVLIRRASLGIPDTLPASVAVLPVRRPGDKPAPPAAPSAPIGLDLTIDAPGQIFVRGRGVDAEMAGKLTVRGNSISPQVGGGLDLRRGNISVAGTNLTFSRGKVGFDGTGVTGKIDPTLDFAATSTGGGVTATLAIGGYVSKPKITLSSSPDLPQDEVLAYLLFNRSAKDLGPFQIAEIAAGLAQLTGVGGSGGFNPLESVRKGLGLDRLSLGSSTTSGNTSAANTSTPTVEGGRYVANGVYVGAKQGTTGNQTAATVQIDLFKGLKLETDVGTGEGANQVGVTYQFQY